MRCPPRAMHFSMRFTMVGCFPLACVHTGDPGERPGAGRCRSGARSRTSFSDCRPQAGVFPLLLACTPVIPESGQGSGEVPLRRTLPFASVFGGFLRRTEANGIVRLSGTCTKEYQGLIVGAVPQCVASLMRYTDSFRAFALSRFCPPCFPFFFFLLLFPSSFFFFFFFFFFLLLFSSPFSSFPFPPPPVNVGK